ncbi:MAG: hypothetical protein AAF789_12565, partial [Bacteroidota bacterium]
MKNSSFRIQWLDHLINFISVILGVTLAFLFNDLSQTAKEKAALKYYLVAMLAEIEDDIYTYEDFQIPDNQAQVEALQNLVAALSNNTNKDSLDYYVSESFGLNSYFPSTT